MILDFEGEPARPLRRAAAQALAAARRRGDAALVRLRGAASRAAGARWEHGARAVPRRLPRTRAHAAAGREPAAAAFRAREGVYELRYELNTGPTGSHPVAGSALLEAPVGAAALIASSLDPHRLGRIRRRRRVVRASGRTRAVRTPNRRRARACGSRSSRGAGRIAAARYELEVRTRAATVDVRDPTVPADVGELDLHLAGEGRHERLYEVLGAHVRESTASPARRSRVWAPNARAVASSATSTTGTADCTRCARSARPGSGSLRRRCRVRSALQVRRSSQADGTVQLKADPLAFAAEVPPHTASIVYRSRTRVGRRRVGRAPARVGAARAGRCRSTRCTSARGGATRWRTTAR